MASRLLKYEQLSRKINVLWWGLGLLWIVAFIGWMADGGSVWWWIATGAAIGTAVAWVAQSVLTGLTNRLMRRLQR